MGNTLSQYQQRYKSSLNRSDEHNQSAITLQSMSSSLVQTNALFIDLEKIQSCNSQCQQLFDDAEVSCVTYFNQIVDFYIEIEDLTCELSY